MGLKVCFVPSCRNTSDNAPEKIFLIVPHDPYRREQWFQAVNIDTVLKDNNIVCCEDHFNLEQDAENWSYYKVIGKLLRLRKDVIPHLNLFHYNPQISPQLSESAKKRKLESIEQMKAKYFKPPVFVDCSTITTQDNNVNEMESECNEEVTNLIKVDVIKKHKGIQVDVKNNELITKHVGVQVKMVPKFRSTGVNTRIRTKTRATSPLLQISKKRKK